MTVWTGKILLLLIGLIAFFQPYTFVFAQNQGDPPVTPNDNETALSSETSPSVKELCINPIQTNVSEVPKAPIETAPGYIKERTDSANDSLEGSSLDEQSDALLATDTQKKTPQKDPLSSFQPSEEECKQLFDGVVSGFGSIDFGMTREDAVAAFIKDYPWIEIIDDSIPDIIETKETNAIRTYPSSIFNELTALFDEEDQLFLIRAEFNQRFFSFISLLDKLLDKYGKPESVTFQKITWAGTLGNVELYRNRVVRYVSKRLLDQIKTDNQEETPKPLRQESELEQRKSKTIEDILEKL